MNYYEPNPFYDSSGFENFQPSQPVIDHLNLQQRLNDSLIELHGTFQAWLQQRKDQVFNLDSYSPEPLQCQKIPICYDDDDDKESSTPVKDIIIFELPLCVAITPVLSTKDTKDSLIIGDEHLDICDDFTTFSNLLFDADEDFSSSNNESFSNEYIPKEIYSNPLFDEEIISIKIDPHHFNAESDLIESLVNQDSSIISSSKIDYLLDEFLGELILLKSTPLRIDEADCDLEEEIHLIEKFLYDNSSPHPSKDINSENSDAVIELSLHLLSPLRIVTLLWRNQFVSYL
uniref:Uncharacterized protein n=1 Tax=Tanacetum cinerariifolium TaxID=118510 RepID=A0A699GH53_TANCI|nr:hypothetical protein [Tanacetum cinerariifolium]